MEITVRKHDILNEVLLTQGVVERKTTIPILANLLFETSEEKINLVATDLDLGIKSSCPAKVIEAGAITTPAKHFLEIIRSLPDKEIKIKKLENSWAQIKCESASFKIVGLPTSFIAYKAACLNGRRFILKCLCIFSAIMMESSTTIPVTNTSAKSVIRFNV